MVERSLQNILLHWERVQVSICQDFFTHDLLIILQKCRTLNLQKMWLLNKATNQSGKLLSNEKTSKWKGKPSPNKLGPKAIYYNFSSLGQTFSHRPLYRKSDCDVISKSQAKIRRDLPQVRTPTQRGQGCEGKRGRKKILFSVLKMAKNCRQPNVENLLCILS